MPTKLITAENAREMQRKGAKKQGEARSRNAAFRKYVQLWANHPCTAKEKKTLEELGVVFDNDEVLTKKAMLIIPLLKQASQGNLKAFQILVTYMGDNEKYELEIKKLKEEIKKLKLEQKKLSIDTGEQKEIEDMSALADFLAITPGEEKDDSKE